MKHKWVLLPLIFSMMVIFYRVDLWGVFVLRGIVGLTLGTILWSFYKVLKEPVLDVKSIISVILVGVVSFLFVILTLSKMGW